MDNGSPSASKLARRDPAAGEHQLDQHQQLRDDEEQQTGAAPPHRYFSRTHHAPLPPPGFSLEDVSSDEEEEGDACKRAPVHAGLEGRKPDALLSELQLSLPSARAYSVAVQRWSHTRAQRNAYVNLVIVPGGSADTVVLVQHPCAKIPLLRAKAGCLKPGKHLNDEVINFHGALLQDRSLRQRKRDRRRRRMWRKAVAAAKAAVAAAAAAAGAAAAAARLPDPALLDPGPKPPRHSAPRTHHFQTFFWNKLFKDAASPSAPKNTYNYGAVQRWTTPRALKMAGLPYHAAGGGCPVLVCCDRVVVPVHVSDDHWTCALIDNRLRVVAYFDSLGGRGDHVLEALLRWVEDEADDKLDASDLRRAQFANAQKTWRQLHPRVPRQVNLCDCGVVASMVADRVSLGAGFEFDGMCAAKDARVVMFSRLMAGAVLLDPDDEAD